MSSDSDDLRALGSDSDDSDSFDSNNDGYCSVEDDIPERWRFLRPWFYALKDRVEVEDPMRYKTHDVRIGREPDDWKIEVDIAITKFRETPEERFSRVRRIREALIITSVLAEVDYETWLGELKQTARFKAKKFMDLETHQLKRVFVFSIYSYEVYMFGWQRLQNLFGDADYSASFIEDLAMLTEMAAEDGVDVHKMKPITVELDVGCGQYSIKYLTRNIQLDIIRNLHESVTRILDIEAKHRLELQSPTFKAPQRSILPVSTSTFECAKYTRRCSQSYDERGAESEDVGGEAFFSEWVALTRTLTGQSTRPTQVDRVVLPTFYCQEPFFASFCSVLPTARGLRFVVLERKRPKSFTFPASERAWAWLGYGLFNPSSTSSVEGLSLIGFKVLPQEFIPLAGSANPTMDSLWYVWRDELKRLDPNQEKPSRRQVVVMKGTVLRLIDDLYGGICITTRESVPAIVMTEDEVDSSQQLDVLVPGFGFCRVDQCSLHKKKHRPTNDEALVSGTTVLPRSGRGVTTLLHEDDRGDDYDFCDTESDDDNDEATRGNHIQELLALVGSRLTSLSIASDTLNDDLLAACLGACPQLQNLRLAHMDMHTMLPIGQFHEEGRHLVSLELRQFAVPTDALDAVLRGVADDQNGEYKLERLCIAEPSLLSLDWSTSDALTRLLTNNRRLTHLHVPKTESTWGDRAEERFSDFRGNAIHIPLVESSRLAFLSILHRHNPGSLLTEDLVRNVFQLAASSDRG